MTDARPSKKQRELLNFIDGFIKGNGYGPSYREIMRALEYKSVSTVAVHVDGLISRGFLRKTNHSARSLEVVTSEVQVKASSKPDVHIAWLQKEIESREAADTERAKEETAVLVQALAILQPRSDS